MSASTVRAAILNYLSSPPIAGLGKFYKAEPFFSPGTDRNPLTGGSPGAGAVGFVWIAESSEERITVGEGTGYKAVEHSVTIALKYSYLRQADTAGPDAYVNPLDDLVGAVVARVRADPTFNSAGAIFQAGEGQVGTAAGKDIVIHWGQPVLVGGRVECWVALDVWVIEIVQA